MSKDYQSIADELHTVTQRLHEAQQALMIQGREMKRLQDQLSQKTELARRYNREIEQLHASNMKLCAEIHQRAPTC